MKLRHDSIESINARLQEIPGLALAMIEVTVDGDADDADDDHDDDDEHHRGDRDDDGHDA